MSDETLLEEAREQFDLCVEREDENRKAYEADIDFALLENQWPEAIRRERELDGRPCLTANLLAPMIRQVVNDARQNKPGITVHPADDKADPETAEIFNGLIRNIEQSSNAEVAYDTALECAVAGGFGYIRINTAYSSDDTFEQDIVIERIANPLSVYGDCRSTAADSSDWNYAFVTDTMAKAAFEKQYKGADPVNWNDDGYSSLTAPWLNGDDVMVAEYWTREEVPRTILALSDGSVVGEDEYAANKAMFDALGVEVVGRPRQVRSHKVTNRVMSGAEVLSTVEWKGRYIPIIPVYGSEINLKGKRHFRSLIRSAKDAQRMRNYWRTTSTEMVALAPKTPFIGKKGAFETDAAKWATANTQNHAFIEYDGPEPPARQPYASIPAGALQEALNASDDIKAIVGIYDASLGARSNETSGKAIQARDAQADTGTFHFIDNLSRAIRHAGRVMIDLIPQVYGVERIVRIIGADGEPEMAPVNQPVMMPVKDPKTGEPQTDENGQVREIEKIFDLTVGKYDLTVKAGPSFASKREEFVQMSSELMRGNPMLQQVLTPMIIKNFDIPDAKEIIEKLEAMSPGNPAVKQVQDEAKQFIGDLQGQMQQLQQQLQAAEQAANDKSVANDLKARELEIKEFEAITAREVAMKPDPLPSPAYEARN